MLDKVKPDSGFEVITKHFESIRKLTEDLCQGLDVEDYNLQAMADTSPVKWHLAHTSWFFETIILKRFESDFEPFHEQFEYLFNSYYNAIGEQFLRPNRHLLSRPTVAEVFEYRRNINERMVELLSSAEGNPKTDILPLTVLGINHEQQHQELLLTDLKYNFYQNPLMPSYRHAETDPPENSVNDLKQRWITFDSGVCTIGKALSDGVAEKFGFDNESPQHKHYLQGFQMCSCLITNAEYIDFIEQGGYQRSELWLSDGWAVKNEHGWKAPLYWFKKDDAWYHYTLDGVKKVQDSEPVAHVSYYEADAFAAWKGARLPTEQEWERVAAEQLVSGSFLQAEHLKPIAPKTGDAVVKQVFGELWQWTSSSYSPYPGYRPLAGAVGEYNGKFMINQYVLRGGSCVSSQGHIRATYRNFFYPDARWQFSGIRLAKDL
ncbi:ergothioneine biosynthesis protein EgtB [Kangiella sp. HD9-110m-PIT-SAG07]|nr:ergothioneine biosynthesis protein EgtB [Kangiella sp. HD9-110m-PIT-SAG07]